MKKDRFDRIRDQWKEERPDLDPSGHEVTWRISFLYKDLQRSLSRRLSKIGLSNWSFDVLASLRSQGPPFAMSPSRLSAAAMLTSGAMTNRLDRLEAKGWVARHPDPKDRRSLVVQLTDRGKALVDRALAIRFEYVNKMVGTLNETERRQLVRLLRKLVAARLNP